MSRRILLADDSVTIQKVIELTFMDEDYEVTAVSNGDEAVALLGQLRPDFVIADVHMPGANGYEVCRRAKEALPGVPVLLLVGTFEPFDEGLSRAMGADAFLKKPFDSQELLQLVQQQLGGGAQPAGAEPPAPAAPIPDPFAAPGEEAAAPAFDPLASDRASADLPALGDPAAEPIWGNFEAGAETAPPPLDSAAWPAATPVWEADSPADEQVFELDAEAVDLTLGDDSLLPGEAEPFRFGGGEKLEPAGGLEALPSDEAPFRFDPAPETAQPFAAEEPPPYRFDGGPGAAVGWSGTDEAPLAEIPEIDGAGFPAGPSPEERLGVPAGAAPLAAGLDEVERRVHEHEAAPAFRSADPLPPAEAALAGHPAPAAGPAFGAAGSAAGRLSDEDVDRIARRLLELAGEKVVRDVAWEVVPDMAELVIKDRLRELEAQVE